MALPLSWFRKRVWALFIWSMVFGAALLASPQANAASYYVDPATGSMSNPGSSSSPWSTLEAVFVANKKFVAGDVIYLRSGYHGAPAITGSNSGSVTIQPDTGASPKLKTLIVRNAVQWIISGLDICPANLAAGTFFTGNIVDIQGGTSFITLQNCTIQAATDITGWTVLDWQTKLGTGSAINVYGPYSTISNNFLQNVSFGISVQKSATNSLISGNTMRNFYNDASRVLADDCVFEYNTFMNSYVQDSNHDDFLQSWTTGTDGVVGHGTVYRFTVRGNIFISQTDPNQPLPAPAQGIDNFDGMSEGWLIENNVVSSATYHGIALYGAINCTIINNTVVEDAACGSQVPKPWILITEHKDVSTGVPWPVKCSGNVIRNNISSAAASITATGGVMDHNITTTAYSTYYVDYKNYNFALLPTSPAVNAGSTVGAPTIDIRGRTRVAPYDIGAYEYFPSPIISSTLNKTIIVGLPFSYAITTLNSADSYGATGLPNGLSIDTATGVISGTPTTTGTFSPTISATNSDGTGSATLVLTIVPPQPAITSALTAFDVIGVPFNYTITATNSPTSYNATGLPSGLSVNTATGLISGTPTVTGTFPCTISATNPDGPGSAILLLTISPPVPVITSALTTTAAIGNAFNYAITATNSPSSYNATGLPGGLSVNTATGVISGTPTTMGVFVSTISATNLAGTGSGTLSLNVSNGTPTQAPAITSGTVASGVVGSFFAYYITGLNFPTAFSATGLPAGLAVNTATGFISGTPTVFGAFSPTIRAINSSGIGSTTLSLTVSPAYSWSNFAGKPGVSGSADGTGTNARFITGAVPLAVDSSNNIYVADSMNNTIRKVTPAGAVTTVAGMPGVTGTADATGTAARFNVPRALAVDHANNLYIADSGNHTIRKMTPAGLVTTLAGMPGAYGTADGTGTAARFNTPRGLAVDSGSNVYVADTSNNTIRKLTPAGVVTTLAGMPPTSGTADGTGTAARFNALRGLVVDSGSNIYVADMSNHTIRKVTPAGVVTTLAGSGALSGTSDGIGNAARFNSPYGIAMDGSGNLYVGDSGNQTIRKMFPSGSSWMVTTIGGTPGVTGTTDGTGTAARFNLPYGVGLDSGGAVFVLDSNNLRISKGISLLPPVITSAPTATGTAGSAFNYTITATNSPTGYGASGLPTGLSVNTSSGVISGTTTVAGTSLVSISATNAAGTVSAPLDIVIKASFSAWRNRWFTPSALADPTISSDTATPAGDGIPNLIKYALNLNPMANGASGLPVASGTLTADDSYLTLTYNQLILAGDITYIPEVSGDLLRWDSGPGYTIQLSGTNNPDGVTRTVIIQDLTPASNGSSRFMRLKVTRP